MDLPKTPEDQEQKNIIDKLAQFVARNGFEFEQMTKQKQKDNPKFSFLFGGEYFNYYQYRVSTEHAFFRQRQKQEQHMQQPQPQMSAPSNNFVPGHLMNVTAPQMPVNRGHYPPAPQSQLSPAPQNQMFTPQISEAQEQMRQNEHNLMAQHQALMKQQQMMMMMSPPMMMQNQPPSIQSFGPPQIPSPQISSSMPMYSQMIPPHSQSMAPSQPVVVTMAQQMQHSQHHSMIPQPGPPLVSIAGSHNQPPPPFVTQACIPPPVVSHSILPTSVPNPQFFNAAPPCGPFMINKEVPPDVAYYELPAGLMVPLVKLEDFEYNPIDPVEIKLPAPAPPNERLLKAVEAFYAPPSHDRPRNSEGWEQLGLYEFFRVKSQARKAKDDTISSDRMRITSLQNNHAESLQAV